MKIQKPLRRILTYSSGVCLLTLSPLKASDDNDWWSMGPVGGSFQVQSGSSYILVQNVEVGSPAELSGLQAGDYIMGAFGKNFLMTGGSTSGYKGAPQGFAEAIERAESNDGVMPLTVLRPSVGSVDLTVNLPVAGAFGPAYPLGSTKFDGIYQRASGKIHENIDGTSNGDVGYMSGFYGIVLLADPNWNDTSGAKPYRLSIDKMRDRAVAVLDAAIVNPVEATNVDGTPNDGSAEDSNPNDQSYVGVGLENWGLSTWAMFLAEYRAKTGDTSVDATVQRAADLLAGRIQTWQQPNNGPTKSGLMGHGGVTGDYPHISYAGMNIINAHAMTALSMLKNAGATIDDSKMQASWNWVKSCTNTDGNIGYGWKQGGYDSGGRTAGVAFAMSVYGGLDTADQEMLTTMKDYVSREWQRMQHTHAYTAGGTQFYQFVLPYLPDRDQRFIMENQKMFYHFHRTSTDALQYFGGRENNGGDGYVNTGRVAYAGVAMAQAVASGNLTTIASIDNTRIHAGFESPSLTWPTIDARHVEIDTLSQAFSVGITDYQGTDLLPADYTATWTHVSGPATATFTSPNTADTTVNFPQDGTYRIQLVTVKGGYTLTEPIDVVVKTATAPVGYRYGANQRVWNISGGNLTDLTGHASYPNSPDSLNTLTSLDTTGGSNYGQRVSGYIVAPTTGSYNFYVAADDSAEFRFNVAGTDPAGASAICSTTTWTDQYEWTQDSSQTSASVSLTAGQLYYYELLHKQGGGGVHAAVAWTGPGIATPTVVAGDVLVVDEGATLVTQPQPQTTNLGGSATFTVTIEGEGPFLYEWFLDGVSTGGASSSSTLSLSNIGAGHIGDYHCVITHSGGALTSSTASLAVTDAGVLVQGGLWRDQFDGISGSAVSDLTSNSNYPRFPTSAEVLNASESSRELADNYGSRWTGWLKPDVTGDYTFYIAVDDAAELWLSTDDQPANKVLLKGLTYPVLSRDWDAAGASVTVNLTAGQSYYIEVLHKEGGGSDYCGVAWQKPGEAVPVDGAEPIPGNYFSYFTGGVQDSAIVIPPVFAASSAWALDETANTGTSLGAVSATSTNTPISYAITAGNDEGKFSINSSTGEVTLVTALDFEITPSYALTIQATDSTGLIGQVEADVTINDIYDAQFIVDTNFETADGFTGYSGHATLAATTDLKGNQWSTPNDARIWNMSGLAPSGEQCLTLGVAGNPSTAEVAIAGTDHGVSSVTFDYASFSSSTNVTFALSYRVDGGAWVQAWSDTVVGMTLDWQVKPWTSATVDINQVGDVDLKLETTGTNGVLVDTFQVKDNRPNVAPVATNSTLSVAESASGLSAGFVTATDANTGDPLNYAITAGNAGGEFVIDSVTGEITTATALDYATLNQYVLTVTVTDSLGLSDTATVTIDVTEVITVLVATADTVGVQAGSISAPFTVMANDLVPTGQTGSVLGFYNSVADYDAGSAGTPTDPTSVEGGSWTGSETEDGDYTTGNVTGLPSINDNGSGLDAWVVTDNSTAGSQWITYTKTPDAAAITKANANGWIFETNMRFVDDFGAGVSTVLIYGNGSTRFLVFFELDGNGDLVAQTFGTGGATYTLTTGGTGTQDFHNIQMVFDPATGKASFAVDDVRYDSGTWAGQGNGFTGVQWGNGSSGGKGSAAFNQVKWGYLDSTATLASGATASFTNGELSFDPNGGYTALAAGESLDETLTYAITTPVGNSSVGNITVTVNGENEAPVVNDNSGSLAEDAAIGATVTTVTSSDVDTTDTITYAITAGNTGNAFTIDNNGNVTTAAGLDFEADPSYALTVTGTDGGGLSDTATVTVTVTDVNEAPTASDANGNVAENTAAGAAIATVAVTDPDAGDTFSYAITAGNTGNAFAIDANGNITTTAALDHEAISQYVLTVTVTDSGSLTGTATVTVDVTNVNEGPSATGGVAAIAEDSSVGTAVTTVAVTDPDSGDTFSYAITDGNTGGAFTVDSNGTVRVASALDFETTASYALTVTATDGGGLTDTAAITVNVTNVNEAIVANDASGSVAEDATTGTAVATVSTSDPDAGDSVSFVITAGNTGNAFAIDTNGNITTASALDFETTPSYALTVTANDGGGLSDTANVTVTVTDVNEAPVAADNSGTVAEDVSIGTAVATVSSTDPDAGDSVSYAITAGNTGTAFAIDSNGNITTAAALDFETLASYTLTVEATDGGGLSDTATVTVTVTDVQEAIYRSNWAALADQNPVADPSTYFDGTVATAAGTIDFENVSGNLRLWNGGVGDKDFIGSGGSDVFENVIEITSAQYANDTEYTLNYVVGTGSSSARTGDWFIEFGTKDAGVFTPLGVVDSGSASNVTGSLALTDTENLMDNTNNSALFGYNVGGRVLSVTFNPGDAATGENIAFRFGTTSSNQFAGISDMLLDSIDAVDPNVAPIANDTSGTLAEDATIGATVATVSATDPNAGDTLSYAITAGNTGNAFAIDTNGNITTAAGLDFETLASYTLTVTVTDSGSLTDTATVTVTVTDANEAPVANDNSGTLAEDAVIGSAVATVSVNDVDAGESHTFAITAGNTGNAFAIDNNGNITTAAALDFETTASYTLTVEVTDSGSLTDTAAVIVTVTDVVETTAPVVATGSASNIAMTTADLGYSITDDGGEAPTVTLYYGTTDGGTTPGNWTNSVAVGAKATGAYVESLTGLTEGTSYYFTIAATNSVATTWGSTASFATTADTSPKMVRTTVNSVSSTNWTTVDLGQNYNSAVIVATPIYADSTQVPVVTRIRNVSGSSFDLKLDRADGLTADVTCNVSVIAVEEGVYTLASDGVQMEAVKYTSTVTAENNSWNAEARTYQNSYTTPVVVGQVMSANDSNWSVFWSMGSSRLNPADAANLNVGKHVGEDTNVVRANETIGYIVIESGTGTINGVAYSAAVGSDIVRNYENNASGYSYSLSGLTSASAAALSSSAMDGTDGAWPVLNGVDALSASTVKLIVDEDQLKDSEQKHATEQINYIIFE